MRNNGWMAIVTCPICEKPEEARTILVWHVFQRVMVSDTKRAKDNRFNAYWQELSGEWTEAADRLPTQKDADPQSCVVIMDKHGDVFMRGWHLLHDGDHTQYVRWMPPPGPPDDYMELRRNAD